MVCEEAMITLPCGCSGDWETMWLDGTHYRCPACQRTWERRQARGTLYPSGLYIPGKVTFAEVTTQLELVMGKI